MHRSNPRLAKRLATLYKAKGNTPWEQAKVLAHERDMPTQSAYGALTGKTCPGALQYLLLKPKDELTQTDLCFIADLISHIPPAKRTDYQKGWAETLGI